MLQQKLIWMNGAATDFDDEFDEDDDTWMNLDLGSASTTTSANTSLATPPDTLPAVAIPKKTPPASFLGKSSKSSSMRPSVPSSLPVSPPRAPRGPPQSQYLPLPTLPKVPPAKKDFNESEENLSRFRYEADSKKAGQSTTTTLKLQSVNTTAPYSKSLTASKKEALAKKGQTSLSSFVITVDDSQGSTASASTSNPKKREAPWEDSLSAARKLSRSISAEASSSKDKGKGKNAGSLNVKQQLVLSTEQQKVLKLVVDGGKNVFFTGSAGAYLIFDLAIHL